MSPCRLRFALHDLTAGGASPYRLRFAPVRVSAQRLRAASCVSLRLWRTIVGQLKKVVQQRVSVQCLWHNIVCQFKMVAQQHVSVQYCGLSLCVSLGCNTGFSAQRLWRIIVCLFKCVAQHRVLQHSDPVSYDWRASMWYECVLQHGIIGFRQRRTIVVSSFVLSAFVRAA